MSSIISQEHIAFLDEQLQRVDGSYYGMPVALQERVMVLSPFTHGCVSAKFEEEHQYFLQIQPQMSNAKFAPLSLEQYRYYLNLIKVRDGLNVWDDAQTCQTWQGSLVVYVDANDNAATTSIDVEVSTAADEADKLSDDSLIKGVRVLDASGHAIAEEDLGFDVSDYFAEGASVTIYTGEEFAEKTQNDIQKLEEKLNLDPNNQALIKDIEKYYDRIETYYEEDAVYQYDCGPSLPNTGGTTNSPDRIHCGD